MVDGVPVPPGSRVRRLSNSAIALSLASSAVTTRRMSAVVPAEQVETIIKIVHNVFLIIASSCHQYSELLRARSERPSRAAEQRDERAPPHSITSSARASSVGGTSGLSALAVLRLMAS